MKLLNRYFLYLFVYSLGGWVLERIINLIAYGEWYDNSVLVGPYQPLYGSGVVMAIAIYEFGILKMNNGKAINYSLLMIVAILTTAISEAVTGFGYEFLTGLVLWDYTDTFPLSINYLSLIATPLFGVLSFLVIIYIHPIFYKWIKAIPKYVVYLIYAIFITDIVYTTINILTK